MIPFGPPKLVHFGTDDKMGYTLVQLIETSNISGHFCEGTEEAYLDVFSCKDFDRKLVKSLAKEFFLPQKIFSRTILRGNHTFVNSQTLKTLNADYSLQKHYT